MMKKILFFGMLLFAAMTASAQYVHFEMKEGTQYIHIEMNNGTKYELDSKSVKTMSIDTISPNAPVVIDTPELKSGDAVEGKVTINGVTYTKAAGGVVGSAVDLALPSGTLWADRNVGATNPEDVGLMAQWGEVGAKEQGYVNGRKYSTNYVYAKYPYNGSSTAYMTKYTYPDGTSYLYDNGVFVGDFKSTLEPEDDAATVNWGDCWMTPTIEQLEELTSIENTRWSGYTDGCFKVTSTRNGNSIIVPAGYIHYINQKFTSFYYLILMSSSIDKTNSYNYWTYYPQNGSNSKIYTIKRAGYYIPIRPVVRK